MSTLRVLNGINRNAVWLAYRNRRLNPTNYAIQQKANYFVKNGRIHKFKSEFWMPCVDNTKAVQYEVLKWPLKITSVMFVALAYMTYDIYTF